MSYPEQPIETSTSPGPLRPDTSQFWAGGAATAVVAALIALVGILIVRWTLGIPILAPAGDGAWGNAHTAEYVIVAACVALVATGLLYLLIISTPRPGLFFSWIMVLATLAATVYPFSSSAPLSEKFGTAVVNLVLGIAITSLLQAVAARAVRGTTTVSYRRASMPGYRRAGLPRQRAGYDQAGLPRQRAGYDQAGYYQAGQVGQPGQAGYGQAQADYDQAAYQPTRVEPVNSDVPPAGSTRPWE
jgi:Family of unknown function (DUF6069)